MRPRRPVWSVAAILLPLSASPMVSQAVLTGTVREEGSGRPLADVEVLFEPLGRRAVTDDSGRYLLAGLPLGFRTVLIRHIGYHPAEVSVWIGGADTLWADVALEPTAVRLEPVEARTKRALTLRDGFEERSRLGLGRFLDAAQLRKSEHLRLFEVLRQVQGIQIARDGADTYAMSARPSPRPCYMQVYVDGVLLYPKGVRGESPPSLTMFDVHTLEGVEVYRGPSETPGEFGGDSVRCGTLVLWSKQGP